MRQKIGNAWFEGYVHSPDRCFMAAKCENPGQKPTAEDRDLQYEM